MTVVAIDRRLLRARQLDGRSTYDGLAPQVGLSASAVLEKHTERHKRKPMDVFRAAPLLQATSVEAYIAQYEASRLRK